MATIEAGDGRLTQINVFTVAPEDQQRLVDGLIETVHAAREVPGWISASIHRSLDGTRVVNYVQFESQEAAGAVLEHLATGGYLQRNLRLGTVAGGSYEVVYVLEREAVTPEGF